VIERLNPYQSYKESGVPWVGEVPAHWEVLLNQRIFRETTRPYAGTDETQLSLSQRAGLIATASMEERSLQTASHDNWKIVVPGDLVLNRFKAHLGVFFAAKVRGIVTFHYGVFRST
jgi:type I restriction enzyme, S subunit